MRQCLAMIMVLISISLWGQKTITTISFQLSVPQQEYKRTYPVTGAGIRWSVMHRPSADVPLSIGGELGFVVTSTDSKYFDLYYLG
jgi:hypothetical protein